MFGGNEELRAARRDVALNGDTLALIDTLRKVEFESLRSANPYGNEHNIERAVFVMHSDRAYEQRHFQRRFSVVATFFGYSGNAYDFVAMVRVQPHNHEITYRVIEIVGDRLMGISDYEPVKPIVYPEEKAA